MKYYVNNKSQSNGDHEVHNQECSFLNLIKSKTYLGNFTNCKDAVKEAKKIYLKSDGCSNCSKPCHTS